MLYALFHLILLVTLWGRYLYYPNIRNEKMSEKHYYKIQEQQSFVTIQWNSIDGGGGWNQNIREKLITDKLL